MSKDSAGLDVGYPIYGARFINNKAVLVTGGGGEGNHGLPNKITVIKSLFKVSDKSRRLQKFREIVLPDNEDSPMCVDISGSTSDGHLVFIGCNQSEELAKSMSINHHLRKYVYSDEEHLRFQDAAQLEEEIATEDVGEYPKIVGVSSDGSIGCFMTSKVPSTIFSFNPDTLDLIYKYTVPADVEIRDFQLSPDNGKSLCYVTGSSIEVINPASGSLVSSSSKSQQVTKTLSKYILSKVKYVNASTVVIVAALRSGKGIALIQYSTTNLSIIKVKQVQSKMRCVATDVSVTQDLLAIAGNDCSLYLFRLSDFKHIKTHKNYHKFAITCLSFCPNGSKLASGSSDANVKVLKLRPNFAKGRSVIGSIFNYLFMIVIVALLGVFLQKTHETGQLQEYWQKAVENSDVYVQQGSEYALFAWDQAQVYGKIGYNHLQHYGELGYSIIQDKINIKTSGEEITDVDNHTSVGATNVDHASATSEDVPTQEKAVPLVQPPDDSSKAASTTHRSIDPQEDIVSQVTKNIDELTKNKDFDSTSFFSDTSNYVSIETFSTVSTPSEDVEFDNLKEELLYGTNATEIESTEVTEPIKSTVAVSSSVRTNEETNDEGATSAADESDELDEGEEQNEDDEDNEQDDDDEEDGQETDDEAENVVSESSDDTTEAEGEATNDVEEVENQADEADEEDVDDGDDEVEDLVSESEVETEEITEETTASEEDVSSVESSATQIDTEDQTAAGEGDFTEATYRPTTQHEKIVLETVTNPEISDITEVTVSTEQLESPASSNPSITSEEPKIVKIPQISDLHEVTTISNTLQDEEQTEDEAHQATSSIIEQETSSTEASFTEIPTSAVDIEKDADPVVEAVAEETPVAEVIPEEVISTTQTEEEPSAEPVETPTPPIADVSSQVSEAQLTAEGGSATEGPRSTTSTKPKLKKSKSKKSKKKSGSKSKTSIPKVVTEENKSIDHDEL